MNENDNTVPVGGDTPSAPPTTETVKVLFINNEGGGFADTIQVRKGITVSELFRDKMSGAPSAYMIRVNRVQVPAAQILQENDRISITPTKVDGAN